jgi:uncharacterized membrane protein
MIQIFLKSPLENTLAVIVLITLIICLIMSFILLLHDTPLTDRKGWYVKLLPVFPLLAIPAVVDILQTKGIALVFAIVASVVVVASIVIPILLITGKSVHPLVKDWFKWSIPVLVIGELAVGGYFMFLEFTGGPVMCGPSQGCGDVQNSSYAKLFGVLPVGVLGFAGALAILIAWGIWQYGPASLKKTGALATWGFCIFGVLFSTYLTFLEPFVIGATCMWCITSATLMLLLLLVSNPAGQQALAIDDHKKPGRTRRATRGTVR